VNSTPTLAEARAGLRRITAPGDLVITLGAGDVDTLCEALLEDLDG